MSDEGHNASQHPKVSMPRGRRVTPEFLRDLNDQLDKLITEIEGRNGVAVIGQQQVYLEYDPASDPLPSCAESTGNQPCRCCDLKVGPPCDECQPGCPNPPCVPACITPPCGPGPRGPRPPGPGPNPPCPPGAPAGTNCQCPDGSAPPCMGECRDATSCFGSSSAIIRGSAGDVVKQGGECFVLGNQVATDVCSGGTLFPDCDACDPASTVPCTDCNGIQPSATVSGNLSGTTCDKIPGSTCVDCVTSEPSSSPYGWDSFRSVANGCIWSWGDPVSDDFLLSVEYHQLTGKYDVQLTDAFAGLVYEVLGVSTISCHNNIIIGTADLKPVSICLFPGGNCSTAGCPDLTATFG